MKLGQESEKKKKEAKQTKRKEKTKNETKQTKKHSRLRKYFPRGLRHRTERSHKRSLMGVARQLWSTTASSLLLRASL